MRPSPQPSQFEFEMGSFRIPATATTAGSPPSLNAFAPAIPSHPRLDHARQMGSFRNSAAPDFSYPLTLGVSVISVLRLAALLLLFATAVAAADRAPDSPVYSRRVWQSADGLPEDYAQ